MLTSTNLYRTLMSLANTDDYRDGSRGYLPFLLHAKWEADNNVEGSIDFSASNFEIMESLRNRYKCRDIGCLTTTEDELDRRFDPHGYLTPPSGSTISYAIQTISSLDLSEKNIRTEDIATAFDDYISHMDFLANKCLYASINYTATKVIRQIAGDVQEAYDPFSSFGNALCLVNAKQYRGADSEQLKCLVAKIRMDFKKKDAQFTTVSCIDQPEITSDGNLRTSPFVITNLNATKFMNVGPALNHDVYNRFSQTVNSNFKSMNEGRMTEVCSTGLILGQALASTTERCIIYESDYHDGYRIFESMNLAQVRSFIFSDVLESVILTHNRDGAESSTVIYVFNKHKDEKHAGNVLFINGVKLETAEDIVRVYHECKEITGISRMVPLTEITPSKHDSLSVVRYTTVLKKPENKSTESILHNLRRLEERGNLLMSDIISVAQTITLSNDRIHKM